MNGPLRSNSHLSVRSAEELAKQFANFFEGKMNVITQEPLQKSTQKTN